MSRYGSLSSAFARGKLRTSRGGSEETCHPTNHEIWAHPLFLSVFFDIVKGVYTSRDEIPDLIVVELLPISSFFTSTGSRNSTDLVKATQGYTPRIRSALLACESRRQIATTGVDDFPLLLFADLLVSATLGQTRRTITQAACRLLPGGYPLTSGWRHKFRREVKPIPLKSSSFAPISNRYSIKRFNSANAFSISGTVREQ